MKGAPVSNVFDKSITLSQLKGLYQSGLEQKDSYWNLGYPKLTAALPLLQNGLWFVISPENVGKSQFLVNMGYNILANNENAYWLDFSLDDNVEHRLSYILARSGGITINLTKIAGAASEEERNIRKAAFQVFSQDYGSRYRLYGISNLELEEDKDTGEMVYSVEGLAEVVAQARQQIGSEAKLFVTIDGFHDVDLNERAEDENSKLARKSLRFKRSASKENALYLLTAHTRKDSRRRGVTADTLKGEGRVAFDATVVTHIYSDVNLNRNNATVYWTKSDEPDRLCPVLEVDILKNKAGGTKDVIFLRTLPERCLAMEVDDATEAVYRTNIYGSTGK